MGCTDGYDYVVADCGPSHEELEARAGEVRNLLLNELSDKDPEFLIVVFERVREKHLRVLFSELQNAYLALRKTGALVIGDDLKISKASPPR